jgi:hypothetical protein
MRRAREKGTVQSCSALGLRSGSAATGYHKRTVRRVMEWFKEQFRQRCRDLESGG